MSKNKDKCCKCSKSAKDGVVCCHCEVVTHLKCAGLSDEVFQAINGIKNLKWFCDGCFKFSEGFVSLSAQVTNSHNSFDLELKKIAAFEEQIKGGLTELRNSIDANKVKLEQMSEGDTSKINQSFIDLKNEMSASWSSVVKSNIDVVSNDVRSVLKTIDVVKDLDKRANNIVFFNLSENSTSIKDKEIVISILRSLVGDSFRDVDVVNMFRQGKKNDNAVTPRPMVVMFNSPLSKSFVMNSLSNLKSLRAEFGNVNISHDLTREQRSELKRLVDDAKLKQSSDDNFLYRVRGQIGRWKIVRFPKQVAKRT